MPRYVIERNMPGVGAMSPDQLCEAAKVSNEAMDGLSPRVHWDHSYVTSDKVYCVYVADNEDAIREHARLAGIPADSISRVNTVIDRTTGEG